MTDRPANPRPVPAPPHSVGSGAYRYGDVDPAFDFPFAHGFLSPRPVYQSLFFHPASPTLHSPTYPTYRHSYPARHHGLPCSYIQDTLYLPCTVRATLYRSSLTLNRSGPALRAPPRFGRPTRDPPPSLFFPSPPRETGAAAPLNNNPDFTYPAIFPGPPPRRGSPLIYPPAHFQHPSRQRRFLRH